MGTLGSFQEFNPSTDRPPSSPGWAEDAFPLEQRARSPYLNYRVTGDVPIPDLVGAAINRYEGKPYDCLKMQTGLQNKCDIIFWMSPGRPVDQGTVGAFINSGVANQRRSIGSNVSVATTAPYRGIYTGLAGYVDLLENR